MRPHGIINPSQATASGDMATITGLDLEYPSPIFAALPDPVITVNRQGRVVFVNPAAEDLLGFSMSDLGTALSWSQHQLI